MSRWLKNVNTLLERLDDQAETVAEDFAIAKKEEQGADENAGASDIDDILAKRGLAVEEEEDVEKTQEAKESAADDVVESQEELGKLSEQTQPETSAVEPPLNNDTPEVQIQATLQEQDETSVDAKETVKDQNEKESSARKEARTLRRHVVSLNSQLEAAESELQAQRKELEGAAERLEKDRKKAKEEKEITRKKHAEEIANQMKQHEQLMKEQQLKFEEELGIIKARLTEVETRRKQEGGDWNKEKENAIEREEEMVNRLAFLEDEKEVLLSQISTLQGQQAALGSRLESLTQAADNGMAREREAEERLDATLSQHARQIRQRQARETELERQVQELNAALVLTKNRQSSFSLAEGANTDNSTPSTDSAFRARVEALQIELETANAHLAAERERSGALHQQLREMSKESTEEASAVHAKQVNYEKEIADMSLTISKLQTSLREAQKKSFHDNPNSEPGQSDENDMNSQIKMLSDEVLKLRDKVANHNSEALTLKNRLRSANDRATKAEDQLAAVTDANGSDVLDSMEKAVSYPGNNLGRRRRLGAPKSGSIRTAMNLNAASGQRKEQLGKVVDVVDSFAVSTGKYLKRNPLARAGFIFYLLLIHLWTFVLLFFHAHSFETEHADFGAGVRVPHSPHALMQQKVLAKSAPAEVEISP